MEDEWKKMERAKEDAYFGERERESLERLAKRKGEKQRLSPITGKPMIQRAIHGVVIDQCEDSKGIWLDAGELEQIVKAISGDKPGIISSFFSAVLEKK